MGVRAALPALRLQRAPGRWGPRGHLRTICPAGSTCSPVSLWEEGTAGGGDTARQLWAGQKGTLAPRPPARALTVAVREAREALGTRVAPLPGEVRPAVAAAGQVLTRPVCEVRLAVAAWWGWGQGVVRPQAQGSQASLGGGVRGVARMPRAVGVLGTPLPGLTLLLVLPVPRRPTQGTHSRRQAWGESRGWSGAR